MKRKNLISIALFLSILCSSCVRQEAYIFTYFKDNGQDGLHLAYSYDGLTWQSLKNDKSFLTPQIGKDKLMRDPSIVRDCKGTYHMVWTTGWWDQGIGYASSEDLINWTPQRGIPVMQNFPTTKNTWAPELFYDQADSTFYIFWASTVPGAPSSTITDPASNHRQYYVTTKDFITFSPTKLFFEPEFSVIDGSIIHRDEIYYLFIKNENDNPAEKNIRLTSHDKPYDFPTAVSDPITGDYWCEGPTPIEIDDYVYLYFDKYMEGKYGAIRSKDMKTWEDVSDMVSFPKGVRHGTAFRVPQSLLDNLLKLN